MSSSPLVAHSRAPQNCPGDPQAAPRPRNLLSGEKRTEQAAPVLQEAGSKRSQGSRAAGGPHLRLARTVGLKHREETGARRLRSEILVAQMNDTLSLGEIRRTGITRRKNKGRRKNGCREACQWRRGGRALASICMAQAVESERMAAGSGEPCLRPLLMMLH